MTTSAKTARPSSTTTTAESVSKRVEALKELAYKEALKGKKNRHKHGAVIVGPGGSILAKACNNYGNRCHAEVRAIKRIPHDAIGTATEIVVVRAMKRRKYGMSRPCPACQRAIREAKIKVVYYSTDGDVLGYEVYE